MGIDVEATCTPRVENKAVAAANKSASFAEASDQLRDLAEISLGEKRLTRIVQRVGSERVAWREQRLKDYEALPLPQQKQVPPTAPQGRWDNRVAVVFLDGGRAQLRDERWGQVRPPGEKRPRWWRESKISLLATLSSPAHEEDPLPEVPQCLVDPLWLIPRLNEIKAAKGGETVATEIHDDLLRTGLAARPEATDEVDRWSPPLLVRSVVGTFESYDHLGRLMRVEAYHRGFTAASRKSFLGDGLAHNWTVQQKYFSEYTPITDLLHALSYVYQAAKEGTADMETCWRYCQSWITLTWQGKIADVIQEIDRLIATNEDPAALEKLRESRRYLANNQDRMKYDEYRQQGLPITTAMMESTVKRINRRIKGTEKFWGPTAEPQLQLSSDTLSENDPLKKYWKDRAQNRTGQRKSRTNH